MTDEAADAIDETERLGDVVVGAADIAARVAELGAQITRDYDGERPLVVGILKGAFIFMADLVRAVALPVETDFMAVSSYGSATRTSGVVRILKDLDVDIAGRHVILVEDIADSGLTLRYLRKTLSARQPATIEICALLVRQDSAELDALVRYVGFRVPEGWVVGYGLDVGQRHRNLHDIVWYRT